MEALGATGLGTTRPGPEVKPHGTTITTPALPLLPRQGHLRQAGLRRQRPRGKRHLGKRHHGSAEQVVRPFILNHLLMLSDVVG